MKDPFTKSNVRRVTLDNLEDFKPYLKPKSVMSSPVTPSPEVMRAVLWLVQKGGNLKAHAHALMHCNPRIAKMNGYPSMRSSAKACEVSPEYIRQLRNLYMKEFNLKGKQQ